MASLEWMRQQFHKYFFNEYPDCSDETIVKLYQLIFQDLPIQATTGLEYFLQGEMYQRRHQMNLAEKSYNKSLELGQGQAAVALAENFIKDEVKRAALYRQAIQLGYPAAYFSLASLYDNPVEREPNGTWQEVSMKSVEILEEAIQAKVEGAYLNLANYYFNHQAIDKGERQMIHAVRMGCGNQVFHRLINFYLRQNQEKAEYYARLAVQDQPGDRYLLSLLAFCTSDSEERLALLQATDDQTQSIEQLVEYYRDKDEQKYLHYLIKMNKKTPCGEGLSKYCFDGNPVDILRHFQDNRYMISIAIDRLKKKDYSFTVRHLFLGLKLDGLYGRLRESFARETMLQLRLDPTYFRYLPLDIINIIETELIR